MALTCQVNEKCFSDTALCLIIVGVIMALIGLLWPVSPTYKLDASLSAQENESREASHARLMTTIYSVMVVGMGFVLVGAIITSSLLMKMIVSERISARKSRAPTQTQDQQAPSPTAQQRQAAPEFPVNSRSVSWSPQELTSLPKFTPYLGNREEGAERLVDSDQLEMNRIFSDKKLYGGIK